MKIRFDSKEEAEAAYNAFRFGTGNYVEQFLNNSGVPKRFKGKHLKDIEICNDELVAAVATIKSYLTAFSERLTLGTSGFFCGNCGTGKTMFGCIIVEDVCRQGYQAHYTTAWKMIQQIRRGYSAGGSVSQYINEYISKALLVIDEVGVQNGTADERVLLYQVIDGRYNEQTPTILISNSNDPVKDGYLDLRTVDRLKEARGFSFYFEGESYRR